MAEVAVPSPQQAGSAPEKNIVEQKELDKAIAEVEPAPSSAQTKKRKLEEDAHLEAVEVLSPAKQIRSLSGVSIYVKWQCGTNKPRVNHLSLRRVAGVDDLQGMQQDLVNRAFPSNQRPEHLTDKASEFYHYTPEEECLSLPSDVVDTQFKLVVHYDGWEYVVFERTLRSDQPASQRPLLITVVEFESTALVIGHLGVRIKLVSYPIISVRKTFLDDIEDKVLNDPNFKGIL